MNNNNKPQLTQPLCPSARPELDKGVIFGIVNGTTENPQVTYLEQPQALTKEIITKIEPMTPTEVFRTAASCAAKGCQHFDGQDCQLAQRIAEQLPPVTDKLPTCSIRQDCRWWQQEGKSACLRCPQVVTDNYNQSELFYQVSIPRND